MQLHPKYLGQNLRQTIKAQLTRDVEGTDSAGAKIVLVQDVNDDDISKGLVDAQSGFVTFDVKFYAIMFRAFTNEVLLATVKQVSEVSLRRLPQHRAHAHDFSSCSLAFSLLPAR